MSEKLCERARSGPEVGQMMANENAGNGAGQEEACGAQRVARQGYENGAGGRGPLLLSGSSGGEPYYLYADGTAPAKSKVAARPIVRDGGVARRAGAQRAALHASLHAAQGDGQLGIRGQAHGGGDAERAVFARALALSPTRSPRGAPPGLPGTVHAARHGGKEAVESQGQTVWLQLQEATAAIVRLQGVVEKQQARIGALEVGGGAHTGERRKDAQWPQLRARGSSARSLAGDFDAAAAVSPQSEADPGNLEAQAAQLWREVAAAQAIGAAEAAAVVEEESKVRKNGDRSDSLELPVGCGQEAAGAEVEAGEEVVERSGDGGAGQAAAAEASQAFAEAAPELTTEAAPAAAVAQAAAAAVAALASAAPTVLPQATPPTEPPSWLEMLYGEMEEAYMERLRDRDPGRLALREHQDLFSRFKRTAGPTESWQGGVWKEAQDAIERRCQTRRAEACRSPAEMAEGG